MSAEAAVQAMTPERAAGGTALAFSCPLFFLLLHFPSSCLCSTSNALVATALLRRIIFTFCTFLTTAWINSYFKQNELKMENQFKIFISLHFLEFPYLDFSLFPIAQKHSSKWIKRFMWFLMTKNWKGKTTLAFHTKLNWGDFQYILAKIFIPSYYYIPILFHCRIGLSHSNG